MRQVPAPPILCIIGEKNSGKTTLLVRLVSVLVERDILLFSLIPYRLLFFPIPYLVGGFALLAWTLAFAELLRTAAATR